MEVIGTGLEAFLHRQATEKALNRLAEAREQAAAIRQQAQDDLAKRKKLNAQDLVRENREERRRTLALARIEASRDTNQVYEQMLDKVWQMAEAELRAVSSLPVQERKDILQRLLIDAVLQLRGGALEVAAAAHDLELVTPGLLQAVQDDADIPDTVLRLRQQPADIWGGVQVFRSDANVMVDNSFAARLALMRDSQREQLFALLSSTD